MYELMKPTIHMNGTSAASLAEAYCEAYSALGEALTKLAAAAPNGRDYYPQGDGAITRAVSQHEDRMQRIRSVMAEIEEIASGL